MLFLQFWKDRQKPGADSSAARESAADTRTDAALLLRQAERARGVGAMTLSARPAVIDMLQANPNWLERLHHMCGRSILLQADAKLKGSGHAQ